MSGPRPDEDPWEAARRATRDEVRQALAPGPRRCPACGAGTQAAERRCAACGADPVARRRRGPGRRAVAAAAAGLALLIGTAAALVPGLRSDADRERRAAVAAQARLEAAERSRLRADVRPVRASAPERRRGEGSLAHRVRLVRAGERAVTADARRRVRAGTVDGPILGTRCRPFPDTATRAAAEGDPDAEKGRYSCLAYEQEIELTELEGRARTGLYGTPYWLVVDYAAPDMTFCKVTPRAGEGGRSLASVPVPVPCRDPRPGS